MQVILNRNLNIPYKTCSLSCLSLKKMFHRVPLQAKNTLCSLPWRIILGVVEKFTSYVNSEAGEHFDTWGEGFILRQVKFIPLLKFSIYQTCFA